MPEIEQASQFIDSLKKLLPRAHINTIALYAKIMLHVNVQQAALYQLSNESIAKQIEAVFKPVFVDDFQDAQVFVPIVLVNPTYISINSLLEQTFIRNQSGVDVPLSALVNVSRAKEYKYITAGTEGQCYPVDIYTSQPTRDLPLIEDMASRHFKALEVAYKGGYFDNLKLIKEMALILLVSILLLYFILAAQFESLIQPLFILVELPICLSGAFILLYLVGNSINLMSMIGIVVMGGLIINDSILKIDAINQLRRQGCP